MDNRALPYLYKETRINVESAVSGSTVVIRLPAYGAPKWVSRTAQKRPFSMEIPPAQDESEFRQKNLASAASLFIREHHQFPRSFLWRVLENRKVLSIQVADLCKQDNKVCDAHLTLRLIFPNPIRPVCLAFSDSEEHDILNVFALTESNHLYTLTLRPEFFRRKSATEDNSSDWCKIYLSSAFGFKHPHRLVALAAGELIVSLHDGGLLKLNRVPGEDSSVWKETFYSEGSWSHGLRNLIPFQSNNSIRYGKINIELSAITSISSPSTIIEGKSYVFAVSLDHRIKVWNLGSGKIAYSGDLLDQSLPPNEASKYVIHPSHSELIRVYKDGDDNFFAVTYSPCGAGQFKFWSIIPKDHDNLEMRDCLPDEILEPPAPTSDVWTLADFSAFVDEYDKSIVALWILWKNNITYRVQKVDLQMGSPESFRNAWANCWSAVASETLTDTPLPTLLPSDSADCTEKWLEHILYPGRFTAATIETALSIYEKGLGGGQNTSRRSTKNLAQKLCSIVASMTSMDRDSEGYMEYDNFRTAVDMQWRRFYRLVSELDKQRGEVLSLAFDSEYHMACVVTTDGLAAIRECSNIERLWHNPDSSADSDTIARLVLAASLFRDSFSDTLLHNCEAILTAELLRKPSSTDIQSLRTFYDKCNFAGQIVDEDYAQLVNNLGGSFKGLTNEAYQSLVDGMRSSGEFDARLEQQPFSALGMKTIVRGVQETVHLHRTICLDQLMLLVFVEMEVDQDEEGIELETALVYKYLFAKLKRLELLAWLSKTEMMLSIPRLERLNGATDNVSGSAKVPEEAKRVTVLEGVLGHLWGLITNSGESTAALLTDILGRVCDPDSDYELDPALIQCYLLKMERPDLALEILRFSGEDSFSVYIQGRAHLLAKDLSAAAMYFKKAAFGLGYPNPKKTDRHSSGLLDDTEWNLLNAGLSRYYYHISYLFDKDRAYSFVIDFTRLALQFIPFSSNDTDVIQLRSELRSRLFNASLQTSRYDMAYSTLILFTDNALQHSSLRALIFKMCESACASQLVNFSFPGLKGDVDEILAQKCRGIVDVNAGVPYHKILYSWRIKQNDFRGAAAIVSEHLQRLQQFGDGDREDQSVDEYETSVTKQYLMIINTLSCVTPSQAWILSEPLTHKPSASSGGATKGKRKLVTLENMRKEYQDELDRIAAIKNNQFTFAMDDEINKT